MLEKTEFKECFYRSRRTLYNEHRWNYDAKSWTHRADVTVASTCAPEVRTNSPEAETDKQRERRARQDCRGSPTAQPWEATWEDAAPGRATDQS